jgi:MFS family permease
MPTLSGWLVDNLSWCTIFWLDLPLILLSSFVVFYRLPMLERREVHRIDIRGSVYLAVATPTLVLGISWAHNTYAWTSPQIISLLSISILFFVLFLRVESRAPEPMLDLKVLTNRTFIIASLATIVSLFGITAITAYFPPFLQGVKGLSATLSGEIMTPFTILVSLMGIPTGLLVAKTKRYKWMFTWSYGTLAIVMIGTVAFNSTTPVGWAFVVSTVAGFGLGAIPTINALVVQYAVPKRLLGTATGGLYFFFMMGRAIAPAILDSRMNTVYERALEASMPASLV